MTYQEFIKNIIDTRGQWNIEAGKYYEVHHILPVCLGGLPKRYTRNKIHENLIWLYPREHFIAHKLLAEENPDSYKLVYAWKQMWMINEFQERYEPSPEEYELCKILVQSCKEKYIPTEETRYKISKANKGKHSNSLTQEQKDYLSKINTGSLNPNFGLHRSEETKRKISDANRGKKATEETRKKLSEAHLGNTSAVGHKLSDEAKKKISESSKNRIIKDETKIKLSNSLKGNTHTKGTKWYNNGFINKMFREDELIPEDFIPGRLKFKKEK